MARAAAGERLVADFDLVRRRAFMSALLLSLLHTSSHAQKSTGAGIIPSVSVGVFARVSDEGLSFLGSGFLVARHGKAFAATNDHVIKKATREHGTSVVLYVRFPAPLNDQRARLIASDPLYDIALLETDVSVHDQPLTVIAEPRPGDPVAVVGYGGDNFADAQPRTLSGIVIKVGWHDRVDRIRFYGDLDRFDINRVARAFSVRGTVEFPPGASGSPVFDNSGRLLGYLVGRDENDPRVGIVYSLRKLVEILSGQR